MDRITIYSYDRTTLITLPRTKNISVGAKELSKSISMASGKIVKDIIGYRTYLTAVWDYIPAAVLTSLAAMLRQGGFCFVEYPSPSGDASGYFEIEFPAMSIFGFKNNVAVWHDVTLSMTAQEVS